MASNFTKPYEFTLHFIRDPCIKKLYNERDSLRHTVSKMNAKLTMLKQDSRKRSTEVSRHSLADFLHQARDIKSKIAILDEKILNYLEREGHQKVYCHEEYERCGQYSEGISSIIKGAETFRDELENFPTNVHQENKQSGAVRISSSYTGPGNSIPDAIEGKKVEKLYLQRRLVRKDVLKMQQTLQEILDQWSQDISTLESEVRIFMQRVREKKSRLEKLDEEIEEMILSDASREVKALHEKEYNDCQIYMDKIAGAILRAEKILNQPQTVTGFEEKVKKGEEPTAKKSHEDWEAQQQLNQSNIERRYQHPDDSIPEVVSNHRLKKLYLQRRPLRQHVRKMQDTLKQIIEDCSEDEDENALAIELRIYKRNAKEKKADLNNLDSEILDMISSDERLEMFSLYEDEMRVNDTYAEKITRVIVSIDYILKNLTSKNENREIDADKEQVSVKRLAHEMVRRSQKVRDTNKEIKIYTPLEKKLIAGGEVEKYEIGNSKSITCGEKTIMVLGATGTGKTTLINSMINYLFEVDSSDPFRFKLITEDDEGTERAQSVTKKVTAYVLHENRLRYRLTIVDTPGYGDTDGIRADKHTTALIKNLFERKDRSGIQLLNAIVMVVKASDTRLTAHQKHNFNSVLQLFGKDLGESIIAVATFSDANDPPVKQTLKEHNIHFKAFHKFNNSAFFAGPKSDEDEQAAQTFYWKVGQQGFHAFFETLKMMPPKSLSQSAEVLRKREELENCVQVLQQSVNSGVAQLEKMRQEAMVLEKHEAAITANETFEYTVEEEKWISKMTPPGQHTTNCMSCNRTCHETCAYSNDEDKAKCVAMNNEGNCKNCPGKCHWDIHKNLPYVYVVEMMTVTRTHEDLRQKYAKAQGDKTNVEAMMQTIGKKFVQQQKEVYKTIKEINSTVTKLNEIAHYPKFLTDVEYIENLIEAEKSELRPGHKERIAHLSYQRDLAVMMEKAEDPNFDPFQEYRSGNCSKFIEDFNKKYQAPKLRNRHGKKTGVLRENKGFQSKLANWIMF